jgi:hypothetical protein
MCRRTEVSIAMIIISVVRFNKKLGGYLATQPIGLSSAQFLPDSECSSLEKEFFKHLQESLE